MRLRPILLALVLIGGFVWVTTGTRWSPLKLQWRTTPAALWSSPAPVQSAGLTPEENTNIGIYRSASPATVFITSTVYQRDWFYQVYPVRESGSGFLIDGEGRILTNFHVVSGRAPSLEVTLEDKSKYKARVLGVDQRNDLALIKIEPRVKLPYLKLGESDNLQVGQKVLAIGSPFEFGGHQPGQQRRAAVGFSGRRHWDQHGDLRAGGQHRDRLRDAGEPCEGPAGEHAKPGPRGASAAGGDDDLSQRRGG